MLKKNSYIKVFIYTIIPLGVMAFLATLFLSFFYNHIVEENLKKTTDTRLAFIDNIIFKEAFSMIDKVEDGTVLISDLLEILYYEKKIPKIFLEQEDGTVTIFPERKVLQTKDEKDSDWYKLIRGITVPVVGKTIDANFTFKTALLFAKPVELNPYEKNVMGVVISEDVVNEMLSLIGHDNIPFVLTSEQDEIIYSSVDQYEVLSYIKDNIQDFKNFVGSKEIKIGGKSYMTQIRVSNQYGYKALFLKEKDVVQNTLAFLMVPALITLISTGIVAACVYEFIIRPINNSTRKLSDKNEDYEQKLESAQMKYDSLSTESKEKSRLILSLEEQLVGQIRRMESQSNYVEFLSYNDVLTKLPNRRYFTEKLEAATKANLEGAVILIDLDNFKTINDTRGHLFGDEVLNEVAKRISLLKSDNIQVARFGGDEFVLMYTAETNEIGRRSTYEEIRDSIAGFVSIVSHSFDEPIYVEGESVDVKFSVGVSIFPDNSNSADTLVAYADVALHAVKAKGKNSYKFFDDEMLQNMIDDEDIANEIKFALENDGFEVHYQPQVEPRTGKISVVEALIRMKNRKYHPGQFIKIAEENGMIIDIGRYVTRTVIEQIADWKKRGLKPVPVSVNFSVRQMVDSEYHSFTLSTLNACDVSPEFIEIEITESFFISNRSATITFLTGLRNSGLKISIDDFGTGYSSLSYLTFVPVDKIKFDKAIIDRYLSKGNVPVLKSLVDLSHNLNLQAVAEGIEMPEDIDIVVDCGFDIIQGYCYSRPIPAEELEKFLVEGFTFDKPTNSDQNIIV